MNYRKTIIGLSCFWLSSICVNVQAQNNPFSVPDKDVVKTKDAELIFDNFHKFGLSLQSHYLPLYNRSTYDFTNEYPDRITWAVGIDYNFLQLGKFNFRLGGYIRNFGVAEKLKIPNSIFFNDPNFEGDYQRTKSDSPYWNYNANLSFEYINFVAQNFAINFYVGSEFMYYDTSVGIQEFTSITVSGTPVRETIATEKEENLTFGITTGFGGYFRMGKTMVRANFNGKLSLSGPIFSYGHEWINLNGVSGRQIGSHGWDGHHFSFSFTIHPGRKNIKDRLRNLNK